MTTRRKTRRASAAQSCPTPIIAQPPTIVEFVLDETGSMSQHLSQTIGGFNDYLAEQRSSVTGDTCLLTLTKFDTAGLKTPFVDLDIAMVPELTTATFVPGGGTNLRDAIIARIDAVKHRLTTWDIMPRVLFVVMTDGEDTSSHNSVDFTRAQVLGCQAIGWQVAYLGAHASAAQVASLLGFPASSTKSFAGAQMRETMHDLSAATTAFRAATHGTSPFFNVA